MSARARLAALLMVGLALTPPGWLHHSTGRRQAGGLAAAAGNGVSAVGAAIAGHPARLHPAGAGRGYRGTGVSLAPTASRRRSAGAGRTPTWVRSSGEQLIGSDLNAAYWSASLTAEPGVTWAISGTYPSARYASIEADTIGGAFLSGLADKDFPPDPGSVNPFVDGTPRGIGAYTLSVVFGPPPSPPAPGTLYANVPAGAPLILVYRVYLPDTGASPSGNVPLPAFYLPSGPAAGRAVPAAAGRVIEPAQSGPASFAAVRAVSFAALRPSIVMSATPYIRTGGPGLFANEDEAYLYGPLPITATLLYVLRFTAPTTPRTLAGEPFNPNTQLRYWSVCVYRTSYLPYKCLADEQAAHGRRGQVTVVMGLPGERPTNATAANGVAWVGLGQRALLFANLVRNLLPAPTFTMSAFAVPAGATPGPYMGPYAPLAVTCTTADFEWNECAGPAGPAG